MERNFYTEGFEGFLKDKADQYKLYPSEKVWKNVNRKLHPRRKWPYLTAALFLLGIGVGGKLHLDEKINQTSSINAIPDSGSNSSEINLDDNSFDFIDLPENREASLSAPRKSFISSPSQLKVAYINPQFINIDGKADAGVVKGGNLKDSDNSFNNESGIFINNSLVKSEENNAFEEKLISGITALSPQQLSPSMQSRHFPGPDVNKSAVFQSNHISNPSNDPGVSVTDKVIAKIKKVKNKTDWQVYASPGVSYRQLIGKATDIPFNYTGVLYNTNAVNNSDVSQAVNHKPSLGLEVGTALVYPLTKFLRVKAGLQFNYNRYDIKAYNYKPEVATFGIDNSGRNARSINTVSYYRNYSGNSQSILKNERYMISLPLGVELSLFGNDKMKFNVASTIQPTYVFNNNSYLISTNLKNYAQEPQLNRNWNMNAGLEAFLSIKTGSVNWVAGPQIRYQLFSSYKENYPISEHLIDYGFKVGINKTIK